MLANIFSLPLWAHAKEKSSTPYSEDLFKICSSAGIVDSAPSSPNLLVPLYFVSRNFSKYSAVINLSKIVLLPFGVNCISFFSSILSFSHLYSSAD